MKAVWAPRQSIVRPVWARSLDQFNARDIRESYGDNLKQFLCGRRNIGTDPDNMFVNNWLQDVFLKGTEECD